MSKKAKGLSAVEAERKRRTREHILADLSVHHVEGFVLKCGYTVQRSAVDYGYDLWLETYNAAGEIEDDYVRLQLKASDSLERDELAEEEVFSFPVNTKDYRLWCEALLPVFLILYDARLDEAYWLDVQDYATTQPQDQSGKSVRLHIPRSTGAGCADDPVDSTAKTAAGAGDSQQAPEGNLTCQITPL